MPLDKSVVIEDYVKKTSGWTGAEIESIAREAGINAIKRFYLASEKGKMSITKNDFDLAFETVRKNSRKGGENLSEVEEMMKGDMGLDDGDVIGKKKDEGKKEKK